MEKDDQAKTVWLQRLPIRWALGGFVLAILWSAVSSFLQGSFNDPVGGVTAGMIRLVQIIILPLTVLGFVWGYTERAKLDRSVNQGRERLLTAIRGTIKRQVGKAMICGLAFGVFLRLFTSSRSRVPWDTLDHVIDNLGQAMGLVLLAIPLGLVVGIVFKRNLSRKFGLQS
jgi:hypothetical protein